MERVPGLHTLQTGFEKGLNYTGNVINYMNFFSKKKDEDKKRKALFFGLFDDEEEENKETPNKESSSSAQRKSISSLPTSVLNNSTTTPSSPVAEDVEINFDVNELDITNDDFEELIGDLDTLDFQSFQQDDLIQQAIKEGVDLREYSKNIEEDLRKIETQSIDDYLDESDRLADLHLQLQHCDNILEKMEMMLQNFQGSLGNISEEIKVLRDQSSDMNTKKRNREAAQQKLSQFVENVVVSPELTKKVCDDPVNDAYLDYLITLNDKKDYIDKIQQEVKVPIRAYDDMIPVLDRLCTKAVSKVRSYLIQQLNELKKPKTNTQFIKQMLLKKKYFYDFVAKNSPQTGEELRNVYIDIIGRYYFNSFKSYVTSLSKLEVKVGTKQSLLVEQAVGLLNSVATMTVINPLNYTANMIGMSNILGGGNQNSKEMNRSVFTLGDRIQALENATDLNTPVVVRVAVEQNQKLFVEDIFRSVHILLINTATSEYIFTLDFFNDEALFNEIFVKSLQFLKDTWQGYLSYTFDFIGILLMIRLSQLFQGVMDKRNMKCLDTYFDEVQKVLWPKFYEIFEMHLKSVVETKPEQLISKEKDSHTLAKRYAEFSCAIHSILKDNTQNKQDVEDKLTTLRTAITKQLFAIADKLYSSKPKKQQIFLINSFDIIVNQFIQSKIELNPDGIAISKLLNKQVSAYIEEELSECYARMIRFIRETEPKLGAISNTPPTNDSTNTNNNNDSNINYVQNRAKVDCAEMEDLAKDFERNWKQGISHINTNILQNFSNFNTGKEILNKTFTQLLLYYNRFTKIVSLCYNNPPFRSSLISNQKIYFEYRKYNQDFQ
ncbi:hypothetical protein ABK040_002416 [Willaertia magna]